MRNKNDLFTIWQAVDWLECKSWDKVDDFWIPKPSTSVMEQYTLDVIMKQT